MSGDSRGSSEWTGTWNERGGNSGDDTDPAMTKCRMFILTGTFEEHMQCVSRLICLGFDGTVSLPSDQAVLAQTAPQHRPLCSSMCRVHAQCIPEAWGGGRPAEVRQRLG